MRPCNDYAQSGTGINGEERKIPHRINLEQSLPRATLKSQGASPSPRITARVKEREYLRPVEKGYKKQAVREATQQRPANVPVDDLKMQRISADT
jgi:hypothetical protein